MRVTQRKGDSAKAQAIATFTRLGYDVSLPLTESAAYDLIVDDGTLHRVQCKFSSRQDVDLRRIHSNSKGYVVKTSVENSYDWLYVLCDGQEYVVPYCVTEKRAIRMKPKFLLGGVGTRGKSADLENQYTSERAC